MAVTPQTNQAFLREVDEELRRDEALKFARRNGPLLIGALVAGLIAFGAYLLWQNWQAQQAGADGAKFGKTVEQLTRGDVKGAEKPLSELAASSHEGYRVGARFLQADVALQKNDLKAAARIFGEVASDSGVSPAFRNLALIRQTSAEFDTLKPETVIARLKPLAVKDGPWLGSAGELVAAAYLQINQPQQAAKLFAMIAEDDKLPETLRTRAAQMAGTLGVDAIKDSGDKKPQ